MNVYAPSKNVVVSFDMIDPDTSEIITPISATVSVYDDAGTVLIADQAVAVVGNETVIEITVAAGDNTITGSSGARTVVLDVTTATGTVQLDETYVLELTGFLTVPAQSGQTVPQSMILSRNMAQITLEVWNDASNSQRRAALMEAWSRISRMPFKPWRDHETIPDAVPQDVSLGLTRVNELSSEMWALLPSHFTDALKRAQLIEACVLLEGDPTWDRRQDGLISKTVGESSEMFSNRKSVMSSISPKAHREIRSYVHRSITLGRG